MKRSIALLSLAAVLAPALDAARADAYTPWTQWHNALAPQGAGSGPLTLAADGQSNYRIVYPAGGTTQEYKAAQDLRTWLAQMTGVSLVVQKDNVPLGSHLPISVGLTTLLTAAGLPPAGCDLGEDGYGLAVRDGGLFLWGGSGRGVLHAVYAFFEEDLGCRWYTSDHFRIPYQPVLTVQPVERTFKPALWLRDPFYHVAFNEDWSVRNRTNAPWAPVREDWGGNVDYDGMFVHTFALLVPPSQYFATHPEYYRLDASGQRVSDQLCTTNPDVLALVTQKVRQILAENPHTEIISVSKNDNYGACQCPNCKPLDTAEGSGMGSLLVLVNHVAEQIEADYPHVLIDTLAYFDTLQVPKTARPRHNVVIRLCNTVAWSYPFLPMSQSDFGPLLQAWAAAHDKISIWDYTVNYYHYLSPLPNMETIGQDIPFMAANHVVGIMTQGAYQSAGERDWMRAWVIAKLTWDPSRNWYQMMQDFLWGHYGNAAPAVTSYYELLRHQGILYQASLRHPVGGIRFSMDHPFLSAEFLSSASALFDQAEALSEDDDVLHRVERERLAILYVLCEKGPEFVGMGYGSVIDDFETIARREGAFYLKERSTPNLDAKLQEYRSKWDTYLYMPFEPVPPDGITGVSPRTPLSWSVRQTGGSFNVYFGPADPPEFRASQTGLTFDPGTLQPFRTWYWRIESVHDGKTTVGPTWRFTTRRFPDFDADNDVDQADYAHLQGCRTGSRVSVTDPTCQDADLNGDTHVDESDLWKFFGCRSGSRLTCDLDCMD